MWFVCSFLTNNTFVRYSKLKSWNFPENRFPANWRNFFHKLPLCKTALQAGDEYWQPFTVTTLAKTQRLQWRCHSYRKLYLKLL